MGPLTFSETLLKVIFAAVSRHEYLELKVKISFSPLFPDFFNAPHWTSTHKRLCSISPGVESDASGCQVTATLGDIFLVRLLRYDYVSPFLWFSYFTPVVFGSLVICSRVQGKEVNYLHLFIAFRRSSILQIRISPDKINSLGNKTQPPGGTARSGQRGTKPFGRTLRVSLRTACS